MPCSPCRWAGSYPVPDHAARSSVNVRGAGKATKGSKSVSSALISRPQATKVRYPCARAVLEHTCLRQRWRQTSPPGTSCGAWGYRPSCIRFCARSISVRRPSSDASKEKQRRAFPEGRGHGYDTDGPRREALDARRVPACISAPDAAHDNTAFQRCRGVDHRSRPACAVAGRRACSCGTWRRWVGVPGFRPASPPWSPRNRATGSGSPKSSSWRSCRAWPPMRRTGRMLLIRITPPRRVDVYTIQRLKP